MDVPLILAGPILRHATAREICLWLATSRPTAFELRLFLDDKPLLLRSLRGREQRQVRVGKRCYLQLLHLQLDSSVPEGAKLGWDLRLADGASSHSVAELIDDFLYPNTHYPSFRPPQRLRQVLHGSCRKPHQPGPDALLQVDALLRDSQEDGAQGPDLLLLTGDQVYADDVAGPMLAAIHQLIDILGLVDEHWEGTNLHDSQALYACAQCYYQRESLLPRDKANRRLLDLFFRGAQKPIFTSASAHNHLITLAEVLALYLLSWSPACWPLIDLEAPLARIPARFHARYARERQAIEDFVIELPVVRRVFGHVPVYMIFDDHDVTDDWNLSRGWEEVAYGHPFSRRIIGNALLAYWLCQGWGNQPEGFAELEETLPRHFTASGLEQHEALIDRLLAWDRWDYSLDTQPPVIVLDTRTRRWRSEDSPASPSGLLDWEALDALRRQLQGKRSVILVSPTPIFGVKLIETIQHIFSFFGKALMVDAENWMAHPGTARVLLEILRHPSTPPRFIILSGDVHYSFAFDIGPRFQRPGPHLLQFTASGLKHRFPERLLGVLVRLDTWLYAAFSPLHLFTKRRRLRITPRPPSRGGPGTLVNCHAVGQLLLDDGGAQARLLTPEGALEFLEPAPPAVPAQRDLQ